MSLTEITPKSTMKALVNITIVDGQDVEEQYSLAKSMGYEGEKCELVINKPLFFYTEKYPTCRITKDFEQSEDMIIKLEGCGICASDVHCYGGAAMFWGDGNDQNSLDSQPRWVQTPVIPGHEFCGRVIAKGKNCKFDVKEGDRVVVEQVVPCEKCKICRMGGYWMCQHQNMYGFQEVVNGGMAEYMRIIKNSKVYKIPDSISWQDAIMVEPFGCALHCLERADIKPDDIVTLAGVGPMGLNLLQLILNYKQHDPKKLIVLDASREMLDKAIEMGACSENCINPLSDISGLQRRLLSLTGSVGDDVDDPALKEKLKNVPYGCDVYIEATGHPKAIETGVHLVRKLGKLVVMGVFSKPALVDWSIIGDRKELTVLGSHVSPQNCFQTIIDLLDKKIIKNMVTHEIDLKDWAEGFEMAKTKKCTNNEFRITDNSNSSDEHPVIKVAIKF